MRQQDAQAQTGFTPTENLPPVDLGSDLKSVLAINIPCQHACPAMTRVPAYIRAIYDGDHARAYEINREDNLFPAILGRVCSRPCEIACRHGREGLGESVSICHLKRVAGDHSDLPELPAPKRIFEPTGKRIAIVGAGPAGLSAAWHLWRLGHAVTLFDARPKPGGMLTWGIPQFRLPAELRDREIERAIPPDVERRFGEALGESLKLDELKSRYDAVLLAMGCMKSRRLQVKGDSLAGCYEGLRFMMDANQGKAPPVGEQVAVIGGGFTAIDCARMALRLGAKRVTMLLRRTREDSSVRLEDFSQTYEEGVDVLDLTSPIEVLGQDGVRGLRVVKNKIVTDAQSGRRSAEHIIGSEYELPVQTVIVAIGQVRASDSGVDLDALKIDVQSGRCALPGVYAIGDFAHGSKTVIDAIGQARRVAEAVDADLMGNVRITRVAKTYQAADTVRTRDWDQIEPVPMPLLAPKEAIAAIDAEVETGLGEPDGQTEAMRCYLCDLVYHINERECIACDKCINECPRDCIHYSWGTGGELKEPDLGIVGEIKRWLSKRPSGIYIDSDPCIRCGLCLRACPVNCIHVSKIDVKETLT